MGCWCYDDNTFLSNVGVYQGKRVWKIGENIEMRVKGVRISNKQKIVVEIQKTQCQTLSLRKGTYSHYNFAIVKF